MEALVYRSLSLLFSVGFLLRARTVQEETKLPKEEVFFWLAMIGLAAFHFSYVNRLFGNYFTYDEFGFARAYTVPLGRGEATYGGLNQGVAGLLYALWYQVKGFSFSDARTFSIILGTLGSVATFFAAKRESDFVTAATCALLLQLSGVYLIFTSVALEVSLCFAMVPCAVLLLRGRNPGPFAGVFLALSLFTYPGVALVYVCFLIATPLNETKKWFRDHLPCILGFLVCVNIVISAHYFHFLPKEGIGARFGLLHGGGNFSLEPGKLAESLRFNFLDLVWGGGTWYLDWLPQSTFLEIALWGPFVLGCFLLRKSHKVLLRTIYFTFVLNLFIIQSPGMRRMSAALPLILFIAAKGLQKVRFSRFLAMGLLSFNTLLIVPPLLTKQLPFQESFPPGFSDEAMRAALRMGNVYVDENEIYLWFMIDALKAQQLLLGEKGKIYFQREEAPVDECLFYMTWKIVGPTRRAELGPFEAVRLETEPPMTRVSFLDSEYRKAHCKK